MPATLEDILHSHRTRRPFVVGILNVTPDSFSDGGRYLGAAAAIAQGRRMAQEGADVLDVGAESTRPGSDRVEPAEQIARLREVLPALADLGVCLSIDTTRAAVAELAIRHGACIVNDVSAGREDPALLPLVASSGCGVVLMHMLGEPRTMQQDPHYDDVVGEVRAFLAGRLEAAERAGIARARCIVDPGIGFGKTLEHNLALLARLDALAELGCPVLVGASRKRFLGALADEPQPERRLAGSIAAACAAYERGATLYRVHDVAPTVQALRVLGAIARQGG